MEVKRKWVAILRSDKIDFKTRTVTRDKEWHYIKIKHSVQHDNITIVCINTPNKGAPKYTEQI